MKEEFDSEAADFDVSAAVGIKEGGVGRGAESARDVGTVVKEASLRFVTGGAVG